MVWRSGEVARSKVEEEVISGAKVSGEGTCFPPSSDFLCSGGSDVILTPIFGVWDSSRGTFAAESTDPLTPSLVVCKEPAKEPILGLLGAKLSKLVLEVSLGTGGGTSRPKAEATVCIDPLENLDTLDAMDKREYR